MEVGMEVWRYSLSDRIDSRGVHLWFDRGEQVEVDGRPYVRMRGGMLTPMGEGWHPSEQHAKDAAADALEAMTRALRHQIRGLRQEIVDAVA
jgi:hypothetical protein